jgi:hypothetical protein
VKKKRCAPLVMSSVFWSDAQLFLRSLISMHSASQDPCTSWSLLARTHVTATQRRTRTLRTQFVSIIFGTVPIWSVDRTTIRCCWYLFNPSACWPGLAFFASARAKEVSRRPLAWALWPAGTTRVLGAGGRRRVQSAVANKPADAEKWPTPIVAAPFTVCHCQDHFEFKNPEDGETSLGPH